jgi:hypothetical protein
VLASTLPVQVTLLGINTIVSSIFTILVFFLGALLVFDNLTLSLTFGNFGEDLVRLSLTIIFECLLL